MLSFIAILCYSGARDFLEGDFLSLSGPSVAESNEARLARIGLRSPDRHVRYFPVGGLGQPKRLAVDLGTEIGTRIEKY